MMELIRKIGFYGEGFFLVLCLTVFFAMGCSNKKTNEGPLGPTSNNQIKAPGPTASPTAAPKEVKKGANDEALWIILD
jgi:hypothetical protein